MELYEQIRREYEFGAGSIIGAARKLGVHRRMVREEVRSATPARRKKSMRPHVKVEPAAAFLDAVLEADRKAPHKQRHTAKRIWERMRDEVPGCTGVECLDTHWFADLKDAKSLIEAWRKEYNEGRPHASIADWTPSEFASQCAASCELSETQTGCVLTSDLVQEN